MADWIDTLADAIFHSAERFMNSGRPKHLVGVWFVAITVFGTLGTLIAIARGTILAPVGFYVLIPVLLATATVATYCFVTEHSQ